MKAGIFAVAAAIATCVSADQHHAGRRHAHKAFHMERNMLLTASASEPTCGCTTIYETITGAMTLVHNVAPTSSSSSSSSKMTTPAAVHTTSSPAAAVVPGPFGSTFPATGVYTIPAEAVTITALTTIHVSPTPITMTPGTYTHPEAVITVTETNYVYVCPFSAAPAPVTSTPAPASPAETHSAAPATSSTVPSSSGSTTPGKLGNSGDQWGITYTPYTTNGDCKEAGDVAKDIKAIAKAGFEVVRVYSTDCSALANIGSACANEHMKMVLGVFISSSGVSAAQQQVTDIKNWGKWELVELIILGNEALMGGFCSPSELAGFITSSKSTFAAAGYTGPCTTAEPLSVWQEHYDVLCDVVDIVGCQIHAFFNSDTEASNAGTFVKQELDLAESLCPGKQAINTESGWPSGGSCNGAACPGPDEQAAAIASIKTAIGGHTIMFSYVNDPWKSAGAFDCEQSWGAFHLFGTLPTS